MKTMTNPDRAPWILVGANWADRAQGPIVSRVTPWPDPDFVPLGREQVAVYDFGSPPGRSRGDVVLLHGMADVARSLEPLARSLADQYHVVAYDARGHGRSTHPGAYSQGRTRMTDQQLADRLALFADLEHVEVPEAGHMVHFDQPDRINQLVTDFLDRRVPR
jgi:pimeloyl-ACP methyl ester carboxylesterase